MNPTPSPHIQSSFKAVLLMFVLGTGSANWDFVIAKESVDFYRSSEVGQVRLLDDDRVDESSGLAFSIVRPGYVWTHNDSGGKPRLYAFDLSGQRSGKVELKSKAKAKDWEDIAIFNDGGVRRLIIGDCGDNQRKRKSISLYVFEEPDPTLSTKLKEFCELSVRYPTGPQDCEAIAVDAKRRRVLLFSKNALPTSKVFSINLPNSDELSRRSQSKKDRRFEITADLVATLLLPMVTGADMDSSNGDLWVSSYYGAVCYRNRLGLSFRAQLEQAPQVYPLPPWKQIEAIALDQENGVWITSEGKPAPLGRLKCMKSNKNITSNP